MRIESPYYRVIAPIVAVTAGFLSLVGCGNGLNPDGSKVNNIAFDPQGRRPIARADYAQVPPVILPADTEVRTDPWALRPLPGKSDSQSNVCQIMVAGQELETFTGYEVFESNDSVTSYIGVQIAEATTPAGNAVQPAPESITASFHCPLDRDGIVWLSKMALQEQFQIGPSLELTTEHIATMDTGNFPLNKREQ